MIIKGEGEEVKGDEQEEEEDAVYFKFLQFMVSFYIKKNIICEMISDYLI